MSSRILFSPVGGTDPMSLYNCRDGSLLHICRVYRPAKVYLYMSKEILDNQEKDNRYLYCLEQLAKLQDRECEYVVIERPDLTNVHEFDYFYNDFREIIGKIMNDMDSSDELLLNVSSGTPAMKSGLLVLQTLGEYPCKTIQVATPERKMNEHIHEGYDVTTLWELNEDNGDNFENRCREVICPSLNVVHKEGIIKKHLEVYDYAAALSVAETLPQMYRDKYEDLIRLGYSRMLFDYREADRLVRKTSIDCFPVKSGNERKYFEYALNLSIKLERKEYADFIRAISPLIADMFEIVLKKQFSIDIHQYCYHRQDGAWSWNPNKLQNTDILKALCSEWSSFSYGMVKSVHLKTIILYYSDYQKLNEIVERLRHVEEKIRNMAAHQIISVDEAKIKAQTGLTGKQIMDYIKQLFMYTGINIKKDYWNSYQQFNDIICKKMD